MKFSWKNPTKTTNFSKNMFSGPKPPRERSNYSKILSAGELNFMQLIPEIAKIPRFNNPENVFASQPTIVMPKDSKIPEETAKQKITLEKTPNQMITSTNALSINQGKFENMSSPRTSDPPPSSMKGNPGGRSQSSGGTRTIIKGLSTFEKVAMESAFLPIWRSFNA